MFYTKKIKGDTLSTTELRKTELDLDTRDSGEVELSVSAAHLLASWGFGKPDYIDIDLNPDPRYQSNTLLSSAVGMVESMGIKPRWKSKSPWAISVADSICR